MKLKIVISVIAIMCAVFLFAGCGNESVSETGNDQTTNAVSTDIDGVWKYTDDDDYSVLSVEGDKAIIEDTYSGIEDVYTCEINRTDNTITITDDMGQVSVADYEIIQDKLILTERECVFYGAGEKIVFHRQ